MLNEASDGEVNEIQSLPVTRALAVFQAPIEKEGVGTCDMLAASLGLDRGLSAGKV